MGAIEPPTGFLELMRIHKRDCAKGDAGLRVRLYYERSGVGCAGIIVTASPHVGFRQPVEMQRIGRIDFDSAFQLTNGLPIQAGMEVDGTQEGMNGAGVLPSRTP